MKNQEIKIITYHYVRDVNRSDFPNLKALSIRAFEKQIKWISEHGVVINMDKFIRVMTEEEELDPKSYLLTFDDGYVDHVENVMPVLNQYGMTGVFFLPVKAVVERSMLDVNKIQFILGGECDVREIIDQVYDGVAKYRDEYGLKSNDEYWEACAKMGRFDGPKVKFVKNMLQSELPERVRQDIVNNIFEEYVNVDQRVFAEKLYLGVDDIRRMRARGMEFASHGYNHVRLGLLSTNEQETEIKKAARQFDKLRIDKNNWTMCYPYGSYNDKTEEILRKFGCRAGFITGGGVTNIVEVNLFKVNRMDTNELVEEMLEENSRTVIPDRA